MEVSGAKKKNSSQKFSLSRGSTEDFEYSCQSCIYEGHVVEAEGFCQNCREYLCAACIRYHRKAAQSRRHVLLDKHEMPKGPAAQKETLPCTELCSKHAAEVVKFFCKQHDVVGCGDCVVLWHKHCEVDYIPDIAESSSSTSEHHALMENIQALENKVASVGNELKQSVGEILNAHKKVLKGIRNRRRMINEYLDKREQELLARSEKIRQENETTENDIKEVIKKLKFETDSVRSRLSLQAEQSCDLYVTIKQASATLMELEQKLDSVSGNARLRVCAVKQVAMDMSAWEPFGQLESVSKGLLTLPTVMLRRYSDLVTTFTKVITNVRTNSNDTVCDISGIVSLSKDTLAFVDHFHKSVKLMDTTQEVVTTELTLTSEPTDITRISMDELAVTVPGEKKITIVSLKKGRGLSKGRSISADGNCKYIDFSCDRFAVSYEKPAKVEILNLEGKVLNLLQIDTSGNEMFEWPSYVAFGRDMQSIFVSDTKAVIKATFDGRKLATYSNMCLSSPSGLAVNKDGSVLVVDVQSKTVHHITSDCRKIKLLIEDNLIVPAAVCLNGENDTLYISHDYYSERDFLDRKIGIYKLNHSLTKTT